MAHTGWPGRIIDGRYAVESVIGAGGMGVVLKARHKFTGAEVALKVLKPELELDPEIQMRFLAEARAPTAIGHPGIVSVIDAGKAPDGLLYLVMELLVGKPLRHAVVRGELSPPEMRRVMLELLEVLGIAHARGFVHRDLKPDNVFLAGPQMQVKLLDFGIAKVLDAQVAKVRTATGATLGTPAYMSPEQLHDPSGVDARADLWAAGIMAYEMLSGRLPFRADTTQQMLIAVATKEPDPIRAHIPNAPPALEAFFLRALSRDPAGRFGTAAEMAQAFAALPIASAAAPQPVVRATPQPVPHATPAPAGPGMTVATGYSAGGTVATGYGTPPPSGAPASVAMGTGAGVHPSAHGSVAQSGHGSVMQPSAHGSVAQSGYSHGSVAQSNVAAPAVAAAPSMVAAPGVAQAAQGTSKKAWVIGLGAATLVSIAVIVIAVMATRKPSGSTPAAGSGSGSSATVAQNQPPPDAAVAVAPLVDAGAAAAPVDAAPKSDRDMAIAVGLLGPNAKDGKDPKTPKQPQSSGTPRSPKQTERDEDNEPEDPYEGTGGTELSIQDQCSKGCAAAMSNCGNAGPTCYQDCMKSAALRACVQVPLKGCNSVAVCGVKAICGSNALKGSGTCAAAFACQVTNKCGFGDVKCGCDCLMGMSPSEAQKLAAVDACAANCRGNQQCFEMRCQGVTSQCIGNM